ncbi:MAG: serine/threonine-protein kinase [Myxococcales bacterium]|jgi:serine/threonine-protein kinase
MVERIGTCRVLGEIGSGGMAVVYEAIQEPLNRRVAIKALKPSIAIDSQFAERFEREAHFMASLQHENILHVIDFLKDGRSMFIIMEYVDGIDLYDILERSPRLPPDIAAIITLQLARGLDYAHFRGIIHRDIKPANIMVSMQGDVKLMDFGIARHERFGDLTETGTGLGTPSYMSPEQILGDKLDFRSDLFSVGIVLYQMLTGRKPFVEDDTRTVMQKIRLDRYEPPKKLAVDVPRKLERIMARCLQKMPANRYPTTQALIDDLTEFLAPRVPMSHNARLVMFLNEIGVISADQTEEVLSAVAPRALRSGRRNNGFLWNVAKWQSAALALILLTGLSVQAASGRWSGASAGEPPVSLSPEEAGRLTVSAEPWAYVHVDGVHVLTTPAARAIPLTPGRHYVKYTNPYFASVEHEVIAEPGETLHDHAVLTEPLAVDTKSQGAP